MLRQPVHNAPLMRDLSWEKRGDQSGAALPYPLTEVSLKAAPAASILATEAQAPSPRMASLREPKRKPAAPAISLIQTDTKRSLEYADVSAKRIPKNSKPGSQNAASECPSCNILPRCKSSRAGKLPY